MAKSYSDDHFQIPVNKCLQGARFCGMRCLLAWNILVKMRI